MTQPLFVPGMPRIGSDIEATHRKVFEGVWSESYLPGGEIIDGAESRDPGNTPIYVLRPGTLMGKITSGGKYAPSVLGTLQSAYTSGGTELTVTAAQATEIVRRVGSSGSGTLKAIGPPSAAGTVAETSVTYSAVNTTTGVITITDLGVNKVAGTLITAADGSETPITMVPDGYGIRVVDTDGTTDLDVPFAHLPVGGSVIDSQLLPWPADTSVRQWIRDGLSTTSRGKFVFTELY